MPNMSSVSPPTDRKSSNFNHSYQYDEAEDSPQTASSKRKSSSYTNAQDNDQDENGKKKRRKVNHACVYCRRSHMTCDLERPCARCVKRDIGHLCHDEPRDPPKRNKSEVGVAEIAPAPDMDGQDDVMGVPPAYAQVQGSVSGDMGMTGVDGAPQLVQPKPISPTQLHRASAAPNATANNAFMQNMDWSNSGLQNQFQDMHHLHPNYMFNNSEVTNEYNLLNDFLSSSLIDDGGFYNSDDAQVFLNDPLLSTSSVNAMPNFQQPNQQQTGTGAAPTNSLQPQLPPALPQQLSQTKAGEEISRPPSTFTISEQSRNRFYMTAADPAGLSSAEDRLHKLLKAKYDAGMLKPFNYVKGYARLNTYMSKHLSRESSVRILRQLDRFRPQFRSAMQSLTDMQLVLVEMWFERSLMEYDRVFASMAIPACCWRRTGEIFRGNREMAELIGVDWGELRDGKIAIHEIIAEDSLVSYWEKFGAIAFDGSQKAILTSCALKKATADDGKGDEGKVPKAQSKDKKKGGETVKCCFSFTIRRDTHNM